MFRQLLHLAILLMLLITPGCEQPASFSLETPEPKLVVVSNFTLDKAVQVYVSKSQFILDEQKEEYVLDATVEIYEDDEHLETLEFVKPKSGLSEVPYFTTRNLVPKVNTTYTIQVEAPCCAPVMAKSKIPNSISLLSASISEFAVGESQEIEKFLATYLVRLSFEDPGEEKNYYHLSLLQQIHEYTLEEGGDTVITHSYLQSLVFNPEDNDNNRVAHINGGLLMEDNLINNGQVISFELPLNIKLKKDQEILGKLFLELRAVTEEYYRYFSDLSRQKQSSDSPFSEPVIIYDNIDGGLGIFAGYNASLDSLYIQ
ncbi:MAG: DUF4249 domain-containing protein [Lewinellaceae bacterium]|nr:DUF4249 domain-containing protein [Phaeodactylibacter sp.]MCB0613950.1 DUF4249 domain-containing protein [Phaeodactylibacter sp.]MCB9351074.1 DUF4249 domain-containing protein [Lewinellaceae bacterium]